MRLRFLLANILSSGSTSSGSGGSMPATEILNKLKTVDGSGSGLDADLLDGHDSTDFAPAHHTHVKSDITDFNESDYVHTSGDETINGNKIFTNDVTIQGNLNVTGTVTTIETTNLEIRDNEIVLNDGETSSGVSAGTAGISIDRGTENPAKLLFDESADKWKVGIEPNYYFIATEDWVNTNFAQKVHSHTLSDITDFPALTGNAGKVLTVNSAEDGVIWADITVTDELVKADPSDSTAGYLVDKVDNTTIEVDTSSHVLKVKDNVFAKLSDVEELAIIYSLIF